jgi:hypothetical protein
MSPSIVVITMSRRVGAELGALDLTVARLGLLSMLAGIYNLLWTAVVVLMIVRPGSAA